MLATVALVNQWRGASADTDSAVVAQILRGVSARIAVEAGRQCDGLPCLEKTAVTWYASPEPATQILWTPAAPIVSVSEIKEAVYGGWDDADALVENTEYQLLAARGELIRIGYWLRGEKTVRVQFTGGYTAAFAWISGDDYSVGDEVAYSGAVYACTSEVTGGTTAPPDDGDHWSLQGGETALPDDLVRAACLQTVFELQRRNEIGLTSAGVQGGSYSTYARDELLGEVRDTARRYRRMGG